ncbi:YebO family protein, partial [Escherichia coli]|uniref:YebO family protein n=1 Tax=Escherichia coli TaxID=562 RepID=UPI0020101380
FGFAENTDDLFVGKTLLHGDVLMWLMKTLLTSGCTNQRGAGQRRLCEANEPEKADKKTVESQKSVEDEDIIRLVAER